MNLSQQKHFKMFDVVQDYLDERTEVWSTIPILVKGKNQFDAELNSIKALSTEEESLNNKTLVKEKAKLGLATKGAMISSIMQAYATIEGKPEVAQQYSHSKSGIKRMRDGTVVSGMRALSMAAAENLEALAEYAMTQERIDEFNSSIDTYENLIGKPREGIVKKGMIVDQLELAFDTANGILRNQLDKLMILFKESHPEFYDGYIRSRIIED